MDVDIDKMNSDICKLRDSITYDKAKFDQAVDSNAKKSRVLDKYEKTCDLVQEIRDYRNKISNLLVICNKKASTYRDERKELVENTVEENLRYIYPEEDFKVILDLDISKKGRETCQLLLGSKPDSHGNRKYSVTTAKNGRFVRQLVAVVVVYTLNYLKGADNFFMDEAFSSSDSINLTKLKPLMDMIVRDGMQVILIEHKHEMYSDLDRHQINLIKNRNTGESKIVSVRDLKGVCDNDS